MSQKVSVIIPAYKSAKTICRAVDSVLAQTTPAHEVVIVDDGSPDDQNEVIERTYGDRVILVRKPNGKTASARNAGIDRATGDFIAFLDADDYWQPHKVAAQLAVFEQHPEVALVSGRFLEQEPDGTQRLSDEHRGERIEWDSVIRPMGPAVFLLASQIWTGTVMVRREAVGSHRFETGLEPAEDRDFWIRIARDNAAWLCFEPLAVCVLEPGSISRSAIDRDCTNMLRVVDRYKPLLGPLPSRQWESYVFARWASIEAMPSRALPKLLRSIWLWPGPYYSCPNHDLRFPRLKRLAVLLLSATGARKPETM